MQFITLIFLILYLLVCKVSVASSRIFTMISDEHICNTDEKLRRIVLNGTAHT